MMEDEQLININYYYYNKTQIDNILKSYAVKNHTHSQYMTNTNLATKVDVAQGTSNALKNVVTDSNGNITTENKPTIPVKVSDLTNDMGYIDDATLTTLNTEINNKVDKSDIQNNLTSTATTKPLSAKQGQILKTLVNSKADLSHEHNTNDITDSNAYVNIGTTENNTQTDINNNIDIELGKKVNNTDIASATKDGLMSKTDKEKLDTSTLVIQQCVATSTNHLNFISTGSSNTKITTLKHGITLIGYFMTSNLENATLNINNTGDYPIFYKQRRIKDNEVPVRSPCLLMYITWTSINSGNGAWVMFDMPFSEHTHEEYAPTEHQSTDGTYGVGDSTHYGHVKVDDDMSGYSTNPVQNRIVKDYVDATLSNVIAGDIDIGQTHSHDDRYYTKGEVDDELLNKVSLSIQIPDAANLNTYDEPGLYFYPSSSKAKNILNYPEADPSTLTNTKANAFTLLIEKLSPASTKQTLSVYNANNTNPRTFIRVKKASGEWNDWKELSFTDHSHSEYLTAHQDISGKEDKTNKITSLSSSATDTQYPSAKLLYNQLQLKSNTNHTHSNYLTAHQDISGKENITNKVTSLSSSSTNDEYPSAKLLYDQLQLKSNTNHTHSNYFTTQNAQNKEDKTNKITSLSSSVTDTQYPSAKLLYDQLQLKSNNDHTHNIYINASASNPASLNDVTNPGFYYNNKNGEAAYITPLPEPGYAFFLIVESWNSNTTKQTITNYNTNNTYTRIQYNGTWGKWTQLTNNQENISSTHEAGTNAWTGISNKIDKIKAGTVIYFTLKQEPTTDNVTLELILANNQGLTDTTGPKNVYYMNNVRLTNQYPKGSVIPLINGGTNWYVLGAHTHSYNDLNDKPTNATTTTNGLMSSIDKNNLDKLISSTDTIKNAHTHSYNDLNDKPTIDNTDGGTLNSNRLITSGAVYNGLNTKSPKNHTHGEISSDGTLTETTNSVNNIVVTDTTDNSIKVVNKVPFANLDGAAASSHTHTWITVPLTGNPAEESRLFVNTAMRMCELRFRAAFNAAEAYHYYTWEPEDWGAIPSAYRPSAYIYGSINYGGILIIYGNTGKIGGMFTKGWKDAGIAISGSAMWHY